MISVEEAQKTILSTCRTWGTDRIPLEQALGCVLAEDIRADRDFPPFTRVSMDGISISFDDFEKGQRIFPIKGTQAAGAPPLRLKEAGVCLEVMTGAMLPEGTDCVIRYEDLSITDGQAHILIEDVRQNQNAHQQGSDRKAGDILLTSGTKLRAPEIGVAATVGCTNLTVFKAPVIRIISTGDELVAVNEQPLPYQIRQSNGYTLQAILDQNGYKSTRHHLPDVEETLKSQLGEMLKTTDVFILTGGVSMGKFDFLPKIFEELGIQKIFHRVQQRPGKPFWFGKGEGGQLFFALPGNPVSSFMCTCRYVIPFLKQCFQQDQTILFARLAESIHFRPNLTYFAQVKLAFAEDGCLVAHPIQGHGSGDLANLVDVDAFLELPAGKDVYPAEAGFRVYSFNF
ncbi:MAG: molybdopterin molybdotransferase MoeA [Saprospiraceae bacterium]|nr:molybdopterin molybdotransferase MoeA [Saprospiraceae bacterium]